MFHKTRSSFLLQEKVTQNERTVDLGDDHVDPRLWISGGLAISIRYRRLGSSGVEQYSESESKRTPGDGW